MRKFCCSEHGIPKGKCIWFCSKFLNWIYYFQYFKRDCLHVPIAVERHAGRVIHLEYVGEAEITKTILLVGKVKFCTIAVLSFCVHFNKDMDVSWHWLEAFTVGPGRKILPFLPPQKCFVFPKSSIIIIIIIDHTFLELSFLAQRQMYVSRGKPLMPPSPKNHVHTHKSLVQITSKCISFVSSLCHTSDLSDLIDLLTPCISQPRVSLTILEVQT